MTLGSHTGSAYRIMVRNGAWFLIVPDGTELGPYLHGRMAVKIALASLRPIRRLGGEAPLLVRDSRGQFRACDIVDVSIPLLPCRRCEEDWSRGGPSCPLCHELLEKKA